MRSLCFAAALIVPLMVVAPVFADGVVPPPPPAVLAGPCNMPSPAEFVPPPPPPGWDKILESDGRPGPVAFAPIETRRIDFSKTPAGTFQLLSPDAQKPIEIEFKYNPIRAQYADPAPEPGSLLVFGTGVIGLVCHWARRGRAVAETSIEL